MQLIKYVFICLLGVFIGLMINIPSKQKSKIKTVSTFSAETKDGVKGEVTINDEISISERNMIIGEIQKYSYDSLFNDNLIALKQIDNSISYPLTLKFPMKQNNKVSYNNGSHITNM